jgi:RNA polymerase sigma-70 factor (ECF subfamily)
MIESSDAAEDIVQDVFIWLWEHRETLEVRGTLRSYLYGSVRNHTLTALRRARLEERCAIDFLYAPTLPGAGTGAIRPDTAIEQQELAQALARALEQLTPRVRQVALLRWRDQLSRSEIAVVLGVALPTVNNQLTLAARVLRQLLAGEKKS